MINTFFAENGGLAKAIPGYKTRKPQLEMALAVEMAVKQKSALVVEAETGTGKTFAYLAPALLTGKKTVISTGSKALQEQLFSRDLPTLVDASGYTGLVALLKGRANYLCLERLNRFMLESHTQDENQLADLVTVKSWSVSCDSGDIGGLAELAEDASILPMITSTNDNCLGRDCPCYEDCFLVKARKKAMEADLVVINHHLFFADLAIKDTGFGELVPDADIYIFDEAHQIPDIASVYFGQSLSSRQLLELCKDVDFSYRTEVRDMAQLGKVADRLRSMVLDLRLAFGIEKGNGSWRDKMAHMNGEVQRLTDAMTLLYDVLKLALGRSEVLDHCFERLTEFRTRLTLLLDTQQPGFSFWYECTRQHFSLNITPLSVATRFREELDKKSAAWVFTSATITVNQDFKHFTEILGLSHADTLALDSPFDYQNQAILAVPRLLPEPGTPGLAGKLVAALAPVIRASKGRCFFLCTSHQMMNELSSLFREELDFPVLMQGEKSKQALLKEFVEAGNALLVATGAFWEGVDVRGQELSCVIIDKIPFTSPEDPMLKARMEDAKLTGLDPFAQVQLPEAVITLKQGAGRLIRDETDKGALIICDTRLVSRNYGNIFLNSLPSMPRTRDLKKVVSFLEKLD